MWFKLLGVLTQSAESNHGLALPNWFENSLESQDFLVRALTEPAGAGAGSSDEVGLRVSIQMVTSGPLLWNHIVTGTFPEGQNLLNFLFRHGIVAVGLAKIGHIRICGSAGALAGREPGNSCNRNCCPVNHGSFEANLHGRRNGISGLPGYACTALPASSSAELWSPTAAKLSASSSPSRIVPPSGMLSKAQSASLRSGVAPDDRLPRRQ